MASFTWTGGKGQAIINSYKGAFYTKPSLGFAFDEVLFEPELNTCFKILGTNTATLTEEEQNACHEFITRFFNEQDYDVYPYDELGVSLGTARKSECIDAQTEYALVAPEGAPMEKFSRGEWFPVFAALTEHGRLVMRPDQEHGSFVEVLTEEEFQQIETPKYFHEVWDFKNRTWVDGRSFEVMKQRAEQEIHNARLTTTLITKYDEHSTWSIQRQEAEAFLSDANSSTPFLDGVLQVCSNVTKKALCDMILAHYSNEYLTELGKSHGKAYKHILAIRATTTIAELDKYVTEKVIQDYPHIVWLIPFTYY